MSYEYIANIDGNSSAAMAVLSAFRDSADFVVASALCEGDDLQLKVFFAAQYDDDVQHEDFEVRVSATRVYLAVHVPRPGQVELLTKKIADDLAKVGCYCDFVEE